MSTKPGCRNFYWFEARGRNSSWIWWNILRNFPWKIDFIVLISLSKQSLRLRWRWWNSIKSLDGISSLSHLTTIGLADNSISDVRPLQGLVLEYVDLSSNAISDAADLLAIDSDSINIYGNRICDRGQIKTLENAEQEFIGVGQQFCF